MEDKYGFWIVSIIAVVAVVSLVVLTMGRSTTMQTSQASGKSIDSTGEVLAVVSCPSGCSCSSTGVVLSCATSGQTVSSTTKFQSHGFSATIDPAVASPTSVQHPYFLMDCNSLPNGQVVGEFCQALPTVGGDTIQMGTSVVTSSSDGNGKITQVACSGTAFNVHGKYTVVGTVVCAY